MEAVLVKLIPNIGIAGIGFAFLYLVMKEYFKQMKSVIEQMAGLCTEIKELVTAFNDMRENQAIQQEISRALGDYTKDTYIKISNKIEAQNIKIDEIHMMCHQIFDEKAKIPIGALAVSKGLLTEEQLSLLLDEQKKFKKG